MKSYVQFKHYIVFHMDPKRFAPFEKTRGPITFDFINYDNYVDVENNFPQGKVPVFKEKLDKGCIGIFARHSDEVVGYMWRKDYDTQKTVKADGYIPLKGKFSHIHFARVQKRMRGRALQLIMMSKLIKDAYRRDYQNVFTDGDIKNPIANRGIIKIGFQKAFDIWAIRTNVGFSITCKVLKKPPRLTLH